MGSGSASKALQEVLIELEAKLAPVQRQLSIHGPEVLHVVGALPADPQRAHRDHQEARQPVVQTLRAARVRQVVEGTDKGTVSDWRCYDEA